MRASESLENLAGALVLAQGELANPSKDARGQAKGQRDYRYASLPAILDAVKPVLTKNGLTVLQEDVTTQGGTGCITILLHVSGEWLEMGPLLMPLLTSAQDNGSTLTYCRRYSIQALLNLAPDEDDDGGAKATRRTSSGAADKPSAQSARTGSGNSTPSTDGRTEDGPGGITEEATRPAESAGETTGLDDPAEGGAAVDSGNGITGAVASPTNYLSKDDQGLLKAEYGGQVAALKAYKARFGDRITRLADITYEMRDEMGAA